MEACVKGCIIFVHVRFEFVVLSKESSFDPAKMENQDGRC